MKKIIGAQVFIILVVLAFFFIKNDVLSGNRSFRGSVSTLVIEVFKKDNVAYA